MVTARLSSQNLPGFTVVDGTALICQLEIDSEGSRQTGSICVCDEYAFFLEILKDVLARITSDMESKPFVVYEYFHWTTCKFGTPWI